MTLNGVKVTTICIACQMILGVPALKGPPFRSQNLSAEPLIEIEEIKMPLDRFSNALDRKILKAGCNYTIFKLSSCLMQVFYQLCLNFRKRNEIMAVRKWQIMTCLIITFSLIACAGRGLAVKKERAQAYREMGEAYMRQKSYTRALREFLRAELIYEQDPYLQINLGLAFMAKKEYEKAISHFQYTLKLKPDFSPARNNLGAAYMENENWNDAIECFVAVKNDLLYETPHFPLTNLGFIYYQSGDYNKSIKCYKEALELMPEFPKALHGLGLSYMKAERYDEAVKALEKAVKKRPKETRLHLDMGNAYRSIHEYDKAYKSFKQAAVLGKGTQWGEVAEENARVLWLVD